MLQWNQKIKKVLRKFLSKCRDSRLMLKLIYRSLQISNLNYLSIHLSNRLFYLILDVFLLKISFFRLLLYQIHDLENFIFRNVLFITQSDIHSLKSVAGRFCSRDPDSAHFCWGSENFLIRIRNTELSNTIRAVICRNPASFLDI